MIRKPDFSQLRAAVLGALLLVSGCGDDRAEWSLRDTDGKMHQLSDLRGNWVVVNFWATWCGPCLTEIPELKRFYAQYRNQGITVLGINYEEIEADRLRAFIDARGINYPVWRAGDEPLVPFEPLKGLPSTFFVNPQGESVASRVGPVTAAAIVDILRREGALQ